MEPNQIIFDQKEFNLNESILLQDSELGFKDKMCRLINDPYSEDAIIGHPGGNIFLNWTIKNEAKK